MRPGSRAGRAMPAAIMNETPASEPLPTVSVVIPVRNEAGNIAALVNEIAAALGSAMTYEVIYVNDGSTDRTESELTLLMASRPWLRQVTLQTGCGKSAAIAAGVRLARAAVLVTMDGDGQNDPAAIPAMLAALAAGAPRVGLVAGQRIGRRTSAFKRLQSRIANAVRRSVLRDGTRDTACGLKAFRRDLFLALPYFDGLHRFLPALVRREGYDIGHLEVVDRPRRSGSSHYGMWDRLWVGTIDLAGVWWLIRRRRNVPRVMEVKRHAD
jgi:dolichol-phosphate mannosyltransferase